MTLSYSAMLDDIDRLVSKARTVLMSTIDPEGFPATRALLAPRKRQGIQEFWHSTNTSTNKVAEIAANSRTGLYFYDPGVFEGLQLTGKMEILSGDAIREELWHPGDELFYPGGVTDPDYVVLHFITRKARAYLRGEKLELQF